MAFTDKSVRPLITGDQGFVGQHSLAQWPAATGLSSLSRSDIDICDKASLVDLLENSKFDQVLHLAALSFVPDSFQAPEKTFNVNFLGTLRLLEALAETGFSGRFLFIGTGDAYGKVDAEALPITEAQPLRPRNPYAVSKVAAEALCYQWSQTGPFEVMMARPFNHIGAGQAPTFALSDFACQIAQIAAGLKPPVLTVGDIDVSRDFTDVSDVLRAYALILTNGHNGAAYNVCSGTEWPVRTLLEKLLKIAGVTADIVQDPVRFRRSEQPRVCASHAKITAHTGWQPQISIDETLLNLYRYWEKRFAK
jgi:GDP-4-dehydro-6-deoxy-D-mannose reductase